MLRGWGGLVLAVACACGRTEDVPVQTPPPPPPVAACPAGPLPSVRAPNVGAEHETLAFWLARLPALDEPLVGAAELQWLRTQADTTPGGPRDPWARELTSAGALADMRVRTSSMLRELAEGTDVEQRPGALAEADARVAAADPIDHGRLVVAQTQMYCTPTDVGVYHRPIDEAFDRNLCTTLHPGELVRVLARAGAGTWWLVHAGHTVGWVREDGLSTRLREADRIAWREAATVVARHDAVHTRGGVPVRLGVALPLRGRGEDGVAVWVAGPQGPVEDVVAAADVTVGPAELTRRELFARVFAMMGAPYGWGGRAGARDCSQTLLDVFAGFGIALGRHSSVQATQGVESIDVADMTDADKLGAIGEAAERGVVLLYMPGHVMLDVGADGDRRFAISSIAEYLEPCAGGGETLYRLDRVAVTDLELGRGTSRGAFIERITRIAVFGRRA